VINRRSATHEIGRICFYFGREYRPTKKSSAFYITRQIVSNDKTKNRLKKSRDFIIRLTSASES